MGMDDDWKRVYNERALEDMPDYLKSCWTLSGHKELLELAPHFVKRLRGIKSILDVGCGPGLYCNMFYEQGYEVTGVDYAEDVIGTARLRYQQINFVVADGYDLPFEDGSYDLVISIGALQCVDDHERFIAELKRVAKKAVIVCTLLRENKEKRMKSFAFMHGAPFKEYHPSEITALFRGFDTEVVTDYHDRKILAGFFVIAKKRNHPKG